MNSKKKHGITITVRDKVLKSWEASMELVQDFEIYSQEIREDENAAKVFGEFAKDEAVHAAKFLQMLHEYELKSHGDLM